MIPNAVTRVPIGAMLGGGMCLGFATAIGVNQSGVGDEGRGILVNGCVGAVLAGIGLLGAMSLERKVGPFVDRFVVDGAEQITRHSINLNWATKSGHVGALVCGTGLGMMAMVPASIGTVHHARPRDLPPGLKMENGVVVPDETATPS